MKTTIKEEIKKLAENQTSLRNQRKTVHIKGERVMEPWKAAYLHSENRYKLRLLYAAYHVLKGRDLSTFETKNKENTWPISIYKRDIDKLIEKYGIQEEAVCAD
jgi:hypothetical protein